MKVILNDTLKRLGISQYKLSRETGIAASSLNNLCNNKTVRVDLTVLDRICEALDCEVEDILQRERKDT